MSASATTANMLATAGRHDLQLPQVFADAVAEVEARYTPIPYDEPVSLAEAVAAAVAAGVDPFADEQVRLILLRRNFHPAVAQALDTARENAFAAALAEHRAEIIDNMRARWTEMGVVVTDAAAMLPGVDFQKRASVTEAGTAEANLAAWSAAHSAVRELDGIAGVTAMLVPTGRPDFGCLLGAPLTAAQYAQLASRNLQRITWAPALVGVRLALADAALLRQRTVTLETEQAAIAIANQRKGGYLRAF